MLCTTRICSTIDEAFGVRLLTIINGSRRLGGSWKRGTEVWGG